MRFRIAIAAVALVAVAASSFAAPNPKEQEIIDKYLKKTEKKHESSKLGWLSLHFTVDRVNRNNDYNSFTDHLNRNMDGGRFSWLDQTFALGGEFGMLFQKKFAWSVGGEYWLKTGETVEGTVSYTPSSGVPTELTNPSSEISVYGFYGGLSYYLLNPPVPKQELVGPSVKIGGNVGYYQVNWDLFPQSQNLNLSTSEPDGTNTTFKGTAPGFSLSAGVDYPVGMFGLSLCGEASYLHLNFSNVAWYNSADQEVVASYNEQPDGRVDLNFSGVRARIALKRFISL